MVWPAASNGTDHINRAGCDIMFELLNQWDDENLGGHCEWTKEELDFLYKTYCDIFSTDE